MMCSAVEGVPSSVLASVIRIENVLGMNSDQQGSQKFDDLSTEVCQSILVVKCLQRNKVKDEFGSRLKWNEYEMIWMLRSFELRKIVTTRTPEVKVSAMVFEQCTQRRPCTLPLWLMGFHLRKNAFKNLWKNRIVSKSLHSSTLQLSDETTSGIVVLREDAWSSEMGAFFSVSQQLPDAPSSSQHPELISFAQLPRSQARSDKAEGFGVTLSR